MDITERLSKLTPEQRKLLELKLKQHKNGIDLLQIPITVENRDSTGSFPLSFAQERLWFVDQLSPGNPAYNIVRATKLEGNLNTKVLEKSIEYILHRHEILRTTFIFNQDEPKQVIHTGLSIPMPVIDLKHLSKGQQEETIKELKDRESLFYFNLEKGPMIRTHLMELSSIEHVFLLVIHHIVSDGISAEIFLSELIRLYRSFSQGEVPRLPELPVQYVDYACWQRRWMLGEKQGEYWINDFKGEIPILEIPTDYSRPMMQSFEGDIIYFQLDTETQSALKELALRERTTLFILLLALFNVFLSKISGMEDIVVGSPVAGRRHQMLKGMIGMFVNVLPLRNFPRRANRFRDFLVDVSTRTIKAFENQEYRYEDIVEKTEVIRDTGRNPLFDVAFLFQNQEEAKLEISGLKFLPLPYEPKTSKFDLTLEVIDTRDILRFSIEYSIKLFKRETIQRFIRFLKNIVSTVIRNPYSIHADISIISVEEKEQILYEFNDTNAIFPETKSIHRLFEEQVEQTPNSTAIHIDHRNYLTYLELSKESDRWAAILMHRGIQPDTITAVMTDRSAEMIIGIFAILKAGGAYLPIDPEYPEARIKYILTDSNAKLLLAHSSINEKKYITKETILLDDQCIDFRELISVEICHSHSATNLAYIIYTSGSTGKPKGVAVRHRSAVNLLNALSWQYPLSASDRYLLKTSFVFDVSVSELFGWYWGGGSLVILEKGGEKNPRKILNTIEGTGITHINFIPSGFNVFLEILELQSIYKLSTLKYIFLAGEVLSPALVNKFRQTGSSVRLENLYGPTEGTVYASRYSLEHRIIKGNIPIGKPLPNVMLRILDKSGKLQPIGIAGELCIAGEGVAEGYLNNPDLTAEKFYISDISDKTYRTGDLARWLSDGNIEFLGRIDHQVKIRGFRIELGEVENQLLTHERIKEAVVLPGDMDLYAYIVVGKGNLSTLSVSELREYLANQLPDYMIPSFFISLERLPVTSSGKIDKEALRSQRNTSTFHEEYTAPATELEIKIADVWKDVLKLEKVGIHEKFFERGGNSFNIVKLNNRLNQVLGEEIDVITLFHYPTISSFANYLKQVRTTVLNLDQETERQKYEKSEELLIDSLHLFDEGMQ